MLQSYGVIEFLWGMEDKKARLVVLCDSEIKRSGLWLQILNLLLKHCNYKLTDIPQDCLKEYLRMGWDAEPSKLGKFNEDLHYSAVQLSDNNSGKTVQHAERD